MIHTGKLAQTGLESSLCTGLNKPPAWYQSYFGWCTGWVLGSDQQSATIHNCNTATPIMNEISL